MPPEPIHYQSQKPPRTPRRQSPIRSVLFYLLLLTPTFWVLTEHDLVVFAPSGTAPNEAGLVRSTIVNKPAENWDLQPYKVQSHYLFYTVKWSLWRGPTTYVVVPRWLLLLGSLLLPVSYFALSKRHNRKPA